MPCVQVFTHKSGRSAGCASVEFANHQTACMAMQTMQHAVIHGKAIQLQWFNPTMSCALQQNSEYSHPLGSQGKAPMLTDTMMASLQNPMLMNSIPVQSSLDRIQQQQHQVAALQAGLWHGMPGVPAVSQSVGMQQCISDNPIQMAPLQGYNTALPPNMAGASMRTAPQLASSQHKAAALMQQQQQLVQQQQAYALQQQHRQQQQLHLQQLQAAGRPAQHAQHLHPPFNMPSAVQPGGLQHDLQHVRAQPEAPRLVKQPLLQQQAMISSVQQTQLAQLVVNQLNVQRASVANDSATAGGAQVHSPLKGTASAAASGNGRSPSSSAPETLSITALPSPMRQTGTLSPAAITRQLSGPMASSSIAGQAASFISPFASRSEAGAEDTQQSSPRDTMFKKQSKPPLVLRCRGSIDDTFCTPDAADALSPYSQAATQGSPSHGSRSQVLVMADMHKSLSLSPFEFEHHPALLRTASDPLITTEVVPDSPGSSADHISALAASLAAMARLAEQQTTPQPQRAVARGSFGRVSSYTNVTTPKTPPPAIAIATAAAADVGASTPVSPLGAQCGWTADSDSEVRLLCSKTPEMFPLRLTRHGSIGMDPRALWSGAEHSPSQQVDLPGGLTGYGLTRHSSIGMDAGIWSDSKLQPVGRGVGRYSDDGKQRTICRPFQMPTFFGVDVGSTSSKAPAAATAHQVLPARPATAGPGLSVYASDDDHASKQELNRDGAEA